MISKKNEFAVQVHLAPYDQLINEWHQDDGFAELRMKNLHTHESHWHSKLPCF